MYRTFVSCFILLSAVPAAAQQGPSVRALSWFDSFDKNGDETLTPDEVTAIAKKQFVRIDANGNGTIDLDEYIFGIPPDQEEEMDKATRRFSFLDKNLDGVATKEEFVDFGVQVIVQADAAVGNGDGVMSRQEFIESITPEGE